jgi:predicted ATPase/DNA-binding CsgD family transcriptional regulator
VEAAPLFAELLSGAPQLLLLITSRVPLRLSAEYELVVKPFDLPDLRSLPDEIVHNDAVRLLIERTQAQGSPLIINTQNVQAVAALCTALDGLPLALELAAARLKVLPPAALLARIDNRLNLLTSRFRDVPERQRTLRDTLAWSYNLLDPPAQQLFRQMGCFRGGCTLEALEYLFLDREHYSAELFDHLSTLIDASLVQQETLSDGPEVRYTMLETVRVFAVELLEDDPAAQVIHERHAAYFVHFAQRAERGMRGQKQQQYLELLERDRDNFQAALEWSLKSGATATTLELGAALGPFWLMRGYSEEGYNWLHLALAQNPSVVSLQRIRALIVAGELASGRNDASAAEQAFHQARQGSLALGLLLEEAQAFNGLGNLYRVKGEYEQAREYLNEALTRLRTLDDRWIISTTLLNLGLIAMRQGENEQAQSYFSESQTLCQANGNSYGLIRALANLASLATYRGDYPTAQRTFTECLALCRVLGDRPGINRALISLGALASYQNEQHGAQRYFAESLQLCRELGDRQGSAMALLNLGNVAERIGNFAAARGYLEESLLLGRALGERQIIATSLANLGSALLGLQELSGALAHFQQALREFVPMNDQRGIALTVEMIACILARQGNAGQAIRLFGGANALRTRIGVPWSPTETASREPFLAQARQMIPPAAFERAWAEGQSLMATELIATALLPDDSVLTRATVNPEPQTIQPDRLTEREIEVLRLLADGLEDAQIATILHVSPRTIHSHLRSIYGKLGVANRTSAVRIAHEQGIL